jgi:hypothetical protein
MTEQIKLALPIVSQACLILTRLSSSFFILIEKGRLSATARGKPSGIATTLIAIQRRMISNISTDIVFFGFLSSFSIPSSL